jgi:tetratricopeptide (TPR) repeat protein
VKYKNQKRYLEAEKLFNRVLWIDYSFIDAYFELGELKLIEGKYKDALVLYQQTTTFVSEDKRLYLGLLKSYIGMNDYTSAISYGERYLLLDSLSADALFVKDFLSKNSDIAVN